MTFFASLGLLAAMTSSEATAVLLDSPIASSVERYNEAEKVILKEAEAGRPIAQFVLGVTTKDRELGAKYRMMARPQIERLAKERGNALALYLIAVDTNDMTYLKRAAEKGNVHALNSYGSILIEDAFVNKLKDDELDRALKKGFECFKRASLSRDPCTHINLGTCYLRGFGCKCDLKKAHESFLKAAQAGHPDAMDYVAATYDNGHGVEKDARLANYWRMKAQASRGDKAAIEWLKR